MFKKYLSKKYVIPAVVVIVLIIIILISTSRGSSASFQSASASIGNVIETVSVTGTVSPVTSADLAFEKSGVISQIYVSVGQSVSAGDPIVSLDSATDQANLESAQATLADMTPLTTSTDQAGVSSAQNSFSSAQNDAFNAAGQAYATAQSALVNYTDYFFNNAQSQNPVINIHTNTTSAANAINSERLTMSGVLSEWLGELGTSTPGDASQLVSDSQNYLSTIKKFMSDLSPIVGALSTSNSGLSQSDITNDAGTMNNGISTLNGAVSSITAAETELSSAGNSSDSIDAQVAKVDSAQAVLNEDTITSPIDGIVTRADPTVGEFMAAGDSGFAVQSNGEFKVTAYVPEADIAKISVGDFASSTLDAYGSDSDFEEKVTAIDPAETVLEGVPTYKITLEFVKNDPRIRSGMTANLEILTHEVDNVLAIPYRAVIDNNGAKSVRLVNKDGKTYTTVPVTTGLKGSDGTIAILSGLSVGDKVVTYVQGQ